MARLPRVLVPEGHYHVYARGNERRDIFRTDADYRLYLRLVGDQVDKRGWRVLAYCLMPNHVHVVVQTPQPDLSAGIQSLHGDYGRRFNVRHDRVGHVFQGRFGSKLIHDDPQLWVTLAYVAANPVEAGLCAQPVDWQWNSVRHVFTADPGPAWLARGAVLARLDEDEHAAATLYERVVRDRCRARTSTPDPTGSDPRGSEHA